MVVVWLVLFAVSLAVLVLSVRSSLRLADLVKKAQERTQKRYRYVCSCGVDVDTTDNLGGVCADCFDKHFEAASERMEWESRE